VEEAHKEGIEAHGAEGEMTYKNSVDCGEDTAKDTVLYPKDAFEDLWKKIKEHDKQIEEIQRRLTKLAAQLAMYSRGYDAR